MPLVSVILPNFNGARTLETAIGSVLNQTHADLELIVVDDGSSDCSCDVVADTIDRRLLLLRQNHQGAPAARNLGISKAQGRYLSFLDADDRYLPDTLEFFVSSAAENPDVDLFYGDVYWEKLSETTSSLEHAQIPYVSGVSTVSMFFKNSTDVRFDEQLLDGFEEWDLLLRLHHKLRFMHLRRSVAVAGHHAGPRLLGDKATDFIEHVYRDVVLKHMHRQTGEQGETLVIAKNDPATPLEKTFVMLNHLRLFWEGSFDLVFDVSGGIQDGYDLTRTFGFPSFDKIDQLNSFVRGRSHREIFLTRTNLLFPKTFARPRITESVCHQPALVSFNDRLKPQLFTSPYEPHPIIVESVGHDAPHFHDSAVRFMTVQDYICENSARHIELPDTLLEI